jgi:hypothetical protein
MPRALRISAFIACFAASTAHAADGEIIAAAAVGHAVEWGGNEARHGAVGTVDLWWGIDDFAWLVASGSTGAVVTGADEPSRVAVEALAGAALALDVIRWVPWAELLVGVAGPADALGATGRVGVGVDYLISPRWAVGPAVRIRPLSHVDGADGLLSVQLRIARRFEL